MELDEVFETVLAGIFSCKPCSEYFCLKGGQAIRLGHKIDNRLSEDTDLSFPTAIQDPERVFSQIKDTLSSHFEAKGFHLFDFRHPRKPEKTKKGFPPEWGGWSIEFKFIELEKREWDIDAKRREAHKPDGLASSKIRVEISENEYCEDLVLVDIGGASVRVYSKLLIILEKIRALCQQHPDYEFKPAPSVRTKDFFDIDELKAKILESMSEQELITKACFHVRSVFAAKKVPLELASKIFEEDYLALYRTSWEGFKVNIKSGPEAFDYYVESLRDFVGKILDEIDQTEA